MPNNEVTWEIYITSKPGEPPSLGRPLIPKKTLLPIATEIAMVYEEIILITESLTLEIEPTQKIVFFFGKKITGFMKLQNYLKRI